MVCYKLQLKFEMNQVCASKAIESAKVKTAVNVWNTESRRENKTESGKTLQ